MSVTLNLPSETEMILQAQAARRGQSVEDFVRHLIERELGESNGTLSCVEEPGYEQLRDELRQEIDLGIAQAEAGDLAPFDPIEALARIRRQRAQVQEGA